MIVEVPGVGNVEFPDGTSPEVMKQALAKYRTPSHPRAAEAMAARSGTLDVSPESAYRAKQFNDENMGPLYDATHMGRMEALGRGVTQGLTFGYGDEMVAALRPYLHDGETYDSALANERKLLEQARADRPGYALGGEVAGAVASPVNAVLPGGATSGGLGARMMAGAKAGAVGGGLYGFGAGEGSAADRIKNAIAAGGVGGGIGSMIPVVGAGVQKAADRMALKAKIAELVRGAPSSEALRAEGRAGYQAIDDAGVMVRPDAVQSGLSKVSDDLVSEGVGLDKTGKVFPGARAIVDAASEIGAAPQVGPAAPVPLGQLDVLRRFAGNVAGSNPVNKADTRLATRAIDGIDDFVGGLKPSDITSGDLQTVQTLLPKVRDIWARMSRSQKLDDAIAAGDNYLSGPASGIRNQFASLLRNQKAMRGFSEAEKSVMRRVSQGSLPEQILHLAGGGMANLLSVVGAGAGAGVPGAALATAGAAGLRKASEAVTRRNAEIARAVVASGGLRSGVQASPAARNAVEAMLLKALRGSSPTFAQPEVLSRVPR